MGQNNVKTQNFAEAYHELATQWHPTKNGAVMPGVINVNSKQRYWWFMSYDDPETDKHYEFEWQDTVANRIRGAGCPFLAKRTVWTGFNDLATKYPELAAQWHPTKNGGMMPKEMACGSNKKVWWYMPYDDPKTGKHFDFEWQSVIQDRVKGAGCPFLSGNKVWPGFNDLASKYPDVAAEWHPIRNGDLTPADVTYGSKTEVWWLRPYDDPKTGKHFDFTWKATPNARSYGNGCPYLTGQSVWPGFNDLESNYPDIASQWHPTKNDPLLPSEVTYASNKKYWWKLAYDDPERGHFEFEWEAKVVNRTLLGEGCPFIGNDKAWAGYNDLASRCPNIAVEWHTAKNRTRVPDDTVYVSTKKVWWQCGKCGYEWYGTVRSRTIDEVGCPVCRKTKARYH